MAVANTQGNDTVATVESFCFGFTMFLTVPHGAFAVNSSPGQLVVDYPPSLAAHPHLRSPCSPP